LLVLDSNVVVVACGVEGGFRTFRDEELVAPPLLWSEVRSAIHEAMWRGEIDRDQALLALSRFRGIPVARRTHRRLGDEAWGIADELGLAKTYDAEYLALARLLGGRLVTLDRRLRRGADRLGLVIGPEEL